MEHAALAAGAESTDESGTEFTADIESMTDLAAGSKNSTGPTMSNEMDAVIKKLEAMSLSGAPKTGAGHRAMSDQGLWDKSEKTGVASAQGTANEGGLGDRIDGGAVLDGEKQQVMTSTKPDGEWAWCVEEQRV